AGARGGWRGGVGADGGGERRAARLARRRDHRRRDRGAVPRAGRRRGAPPRHVPRAGRQRGRHGVAPARRRADRARGGDRRGPAGAGADPLMAAPRLLRSLYFWVVVAIALGVALGIAEPSWGAAMQ